MKSWWLVAIGVLFGLLGAGAVFLASQPPRGAAIELLPPPSPEPMRIHVVGAVRDPGVHALPRQSRVEDAIAAAGGFADDAKTESLNLAALLQDGDQIDVPALQPTAAPQVVESGSNGKEQPTSAPESPEIPEIININTASQELLETLSGIGPVTAEKIIAYREANGDFAVIEEIQKVKGIGPATFEKLKDKICVED